MTGASLLSEFTHQLRSHDELESFVEKVREVGVVVGDGKLEGQKFHDVLILDLHPWEEGVEEVLDILEGVLLVDLWEDLVESVEVSLNEIYLLPAVETCHLSLSLVERFGGVRVAN